jgi:hypothetical protein
MFVFFGGGGLVTCACAFLCSEAGGGVPLQYSSPSIAQAATAADELGYGACSNLCVCGARVLWLVQVAPGACCTMEV